METEDLNWRTASKSGNGGATCVEVGSSPASPVIGIRDTTARERGMLTVAAATWHNFMDEIKAGRADLPRLRQGSAPACHRACRG